MTTRRTILTSTAASGAIALLPAIATPLASERPERIVFIHGRGQQGRSSSELKQEWLMSFDKGGSGRKLPTNVEIEFPFYGDVLQKYVDTFKAATGNDIQARGESDQELLRFQYAVAEQLRQAAKISDADIEIELGSGPKERGPQNWRWVQAIARVLDRNCPGLGGATLEAFTLDVFLYLKRSTIRDAVNKLVMDALTEKPTIVVAHSLGTVVAYDILRQNANVTQVPLLLTLGSPLAVRAVRDSFQPSTFPAKVDHWYNAFDKRDVVALYPLDQESFPLPNASKTIENNADIANETDNRHGISGYLNKTAVVMRVLDALGG